MSDTTDYAAAFASVNDNVRQFNELAQTMCELYEKKNADYGDSFNISLDKYGIIAALTRMSDKFNRVENIILNKDDDGNPVFNNVKVQDEKVEDTLIDLANYAMMTVLWIKKNNKIKNALLDKLSVEYTPEDGTKYDCGNGVVSSASIDV